MISLLIFQTTGLMFFKKEYCEPGDAKFNEIEDIVSGFLSAVFHFFSGQFGEIKSIRTENALILIRKVYDFYIALIISLEREKNQDFFKINSNKIWEFNRRIEEEALNLISIIKNRIGNFLFKLKMAGREIQTHNLVFKPLESKIDDDVMRIMTKIRILRGTIFNEITKFP